MENNSSFKNLTEFPTGIDYSGMQWGDKQANMEVDMLDSNDSGSTICVEGENDRDMQGNGITGMEDHEDDANNNTGVDTSNDIENGTINMQDSNQINMQDTRNKLKSNSKKKCSNDNEELIERGSKGETISITKKTTPMVLFQTLMRIKIPPKISLIPEGDKSFVRITINCDYNKNAKKNLFRDDYGAWSSKKYHSDIHHYILQKDRTIRCIFFKRGIYCTKVSRPDGVQYTPMCPQPEPHELVRMYDRSTVSKHLPKLRKYISWFDVPPSMPKFKNHVAFIEYIGEWKPSTAKHGNTLNNDAVPCVRSSINVMQAPHKEMKHSKPAEVYKEMHENEEIKEMPHNVKQLENFKERQKYFYDAIYQPDVETITEVVQMIGSSPFVQTVVHTKSSPIVLCYYEAQIESIKASIKANNLIGIEESFYFGTCFVTILVYRNIDVIHKQTGEHPIMIGPVLLHFDLTSESFSIFLSHVKTALGLDACDIVLRSDGEEMMVKAFEDVFCGESYRLCTKLIKDNTSKYLRDRTNVSEEKCTNILEQIFGTAGLLCSSNREEFESKCKDFEKEHGEHQNFVQHFSSNIKKKLLDNVLVPNWKVERDPLWTDKNSDNIYYSLKHAVQMKTKTIPSLVNGINAEVDFQINKIEKSLREGGDYVSVFDFQNCIND